MLDEIIVRWWQAVQNAMQAFARKYPLARMGFDLASDSEAIKVALEQRAERLKKYYELMHGRYHTAVTVAL